MPSEHASVRKRINSGLGGPFLIEIDGEVIPYQDCYEYAVIGNVLANIHDSILKTRDKRFIRITVVSDPDIPDPYGIRQGWYVATFIDEERAKQERQSWSILREHPPLPSGPWR